jgi:hypothetical protein
MLALNKYEHFFKQIEVFMKNLKILFFLTITGSIFGTTDKLKLFRTKINDCDKANFNKSEIDMFFNEDDRKSIQMKQFVNVINQINNDLKHKTAPQCLNIRNEYERVIQQYQAEPELANLSMSEFGEYLYEKEMKSLKKTLQDSPQQKTCDEISKEADEFRAKIQEEVDQLLKEIRNKRSY